MAPFKTLFGSILVLLVATALSHKGMVENDFEKDVGVVYSEPNFQGRRHVLLEIKGMAECLELDMTVVSVAICDADVQCTFFTGDTCQYSADNYAVSMSHGNKTELETPKGSYFGRYRCVCEDNRFREPFPANATIAMDN